MQTLTRWRVTDALAPGTTLTPMDVNALMREIERYLEAVALYRDLGCQLVWRTDDPAGAVTRAELAKSPGPEYRRPPSLRG